MPSGSPLFKLFVKIESDGDKELEKKFQEWEKRAQTAEKGWDDFHQKKVPKDVKKTTKELGKLQEAFGKLSDDQDKFTKKVDENAKKNQKSLGEMGKALGKIQDQAKTLNKEGVTLKTKIEGDKQVAASLEAIQKRADKLNGGEIVVRMQLKGNEEVIRDLEKVEGLKTEIDGDDVVFTVEANGTEESRVALEKLQQAADKIDGRRVSMEANVDGAAEATTELEALDEQGDKIDGRNLEMEVNVNGTTEAISELRAIDSSADDIDGRTIKMDVDTTDIDRAKGSVSQLADGVRDLQTIAKGAGIAVLISNIGSLASIATSATGAILGLASAIGSGLVGASVAAAGAMGTLGAAAGLVAGAVGGLGQKFKDYKKGLEDTTAASGGAADSSDAYASALDGLASAQDGVLEAEEALAEAHEKVGEAAEKAAEMEEKAIEAYTKALDKVEDAEERVRETREKAYEAAEKAVKAYADAVDKTEDQEKKLNEARQKLGDATRDLTEAQEDLNRAMRDEPLNQEEAALDLADAQLAVKEATQGISDAEAKLAEVRKDPEAKPEDVADAELAVERARLSAEKATNSYEKSQNEYNDTVADGSEELQGAVKAAEQAEKAQTGAAENITEAEEDLGTAREEQSEKYEDISKTQREGAKSIQKSEEQLSEAREEANKKFEEISKAQEEGAKLVADAQKGVEKAQRGVEKAGRALEAAQRALAKSLEGTAGAAGGAKGKMVELSDAVRALFDRIIAFQEHWKEAFQPAQDVLADLGVQVIDLADTIVDRLGQAALEVAQGLTRAFEYFRESLSKSTYAAEGFQTLMEAVGPAAEIAGRAVGDLGIALFTTFTRAIPYGLELLGYFADLAQKAREFTQSAEGIAIIDDIMARTVATAKRLWKVTLDLGAAVYNVFDAVNQSGVADLMLSKLEQMAKFFKDVTTEGTAAREAIDAYLERSLPVLTVLLDTVGALVLEFFKLADRISQVESIANPGMSALEDILRRIKDELIPAVGDFLFAIFEANAPGLADLVTNIAKLLEVLARPENQEALALFLETINNLLELFLALPEPVQNAIITLFALGKAFGVVKAALWLVLAPFGKLLKIVGVDGPLKKGMQGIIATIGEAGIAGSLIASLYLLAAAAAITIVVTFDYASAGEAFTAAREEGDGIGEAFAKAVIAGMESVPLLGPWVEKFGKFLDDYDAWLAQTDLGVDEWILSQLEDVYEAGKALGKAAWDGVMEGKSLAEKASDNEGISALWYDDSTVEDTKEKAHEDGTEVGTSASEGVSTGLEDPGEEERRSVFFGSIIQKAKDIFGYGSPATTFIEIGLSLAEGIMEGLKDLPGWATEMWEGMLKDAQDKWTEIKDNTVTLAGELYEGARKWYEDNLAPKVEEIHARILGDSDSQWTTIKDNVIAYTGELYEGARSWYEDNLAPKVEEIDARIFGDSESTWTTLRDNVISYAGEAYEGIRSWWEDNLAPKVEEINARIFGDSDSTWTRIRDNVTSYAKDLYNNLVGASVFPDLLKGVDWSMRGIFNTIVEMIYNAVRVAGQYLNRWAQGVLQVLRSIPGVSKFLGSSSGTTTIADPPAPPRMAKGGIEDGEAQGSEGGMADGVKPRVVYGEANSAEAYIVEDRPTDEQLPYLATAASWHNMGLVPMAGGGFASGQIGSRLGGVPRAKTPAQVQAEQQAAEEAARAAEQASRSTASTSTPSTSSPSRTTSSPSRTSSPSSSGGTSSSQSSSSPVNISINITSNVSNTGGSGGTGGGGSPSTSAYPPTDCGAYPVASPLESGQQPYTDAALANAGMSRSMAAPYVADHVNKFIGDAGGDLCGVNQGGSLAYPFPSNPDYNGSAYSPTNYNSCGPSFAMATGGTIKVSNTGTGATQVGQITQGVNTGTSSGGSRGGSGGGGSGGGASGQPAHPVPWTEVALGWWNEFLNLQWFGDPGIDFPVLEPPQGWDPGAVYSPAAGTGFASGGVLKDGIRYFSGGGLSDIQMQAAADAGNSALGAFYSYGSAGEDGGYDCAGLWNWIEAAVVYGAPQTGKRWGTESAISGSMTGSWESGATPGGINIGVDLSGWGGQDGTHMAGDVLDTPYESWDPGGVENRYGHDAFGTWWTMGSAGDMVNQLGPGDTYDPWGNMQEEVGSWWDCQAPVPVDIGGSPPFDAVENWMAALPGMTYDYLADVGDQGLGPAGSGSYGAPLGNTVRDWIIAAMEGMSFDVDETAIGFIEDIISRESGGNPSVDNFEGSGAAGLMQLMPDTWANWNVGGDIYDPVSNIMAGINYMLGRYGHIVPVEEYYAQGGLSLGPHVGHMEGGELMVPLDSKKAQFEIQQALGFNQMTAALEAKLDMVAERIDYQTQVTPEAIGGNVDRRIGRNPKTHRQLDRYSEGRARRQVQRGVPICR